MIRSKYRGPIPIRPRKRARSNWFVLRDYQMRYGFFFGFFGIIGGGVIGGLSFFLLNNNYGLLVKTALLTRPEMVENLERELQLANMALGLSTVGFIVFMALLGAKFSHRIVVPIFLIQEKMREICRGNVKDVTLKLRQTDEFQEFGETYNYLVESLRAQLQRDLDRIEKLKPDWHNRDAVHIWETIQKEKRAQLNGNDGELDPAPSSAHAS